MILLLFSFKIQTTVEKYQIYFSIEAGGLESILNGLLNEPILKFDTNIADALQNRLFDNVRFPIDLPAINVLRAREQGVPSYVKFREFCGLSKAFKFSDLSDVMNQESIDKLAQVYE